MNLDIQDRDSFTGAPLPVDVIADARDLPYENDFDTVVLGEILEHMTPEDAVLSIRQAAKACVNGGSIVITMPHDTRQQSHENAGKEYVKGVMAYHHRHFTREDLLGWVELAGVSVAMVADIDYVWGQKGTGLICRVQKETKGVAA